MKENRQILIKSLPQGKLEASNFCLELATMPVLGDDQVLVKTTAFSISAGARAGLQGSASYAGAPAAGRVMNGSGKKHFSCKTLIYFVLVFKWDVT